MPKTLPVAMLSMSIAACALFAPKLERPNLSVVGVDMLSGSLFQQNIRVKLKIQNPNDRALPVSGLHAELLVGGEQLASGVSSRAFVVPALGESEFDMMITANMALGLLKLANKVDNHSDAIDYEVTGVVSIDLPMLRSLPFHQSGSLSLKSAPN